MPPQTLFDISKIDLNKTVVTREEIYKVNPHAHEFALLDGFSHIDRANMEMIAYVDMKMQDFWVRGHIPGRPIFPGVLMIESAAQMISYFVMTAEKFEGFLGFGAVDEVKFRGQVKPGDRLVLVGKMTEIRGKRRARGAVQGFVGDQMVFEGIITGMVI